MAISVWPVDAVEGAPEYSARQGRQLSLAPLLAGATAERPLGAISGVRPGTPDTTVEATSTTWTVHPHAGVMDVQAAAEAGPYSYALDADVTGDMDPAHATWTRWDGIYVCIDDPAESDGSSVPAARVEYVAGTAANSPAMPAAPDRSMLLARIVVPQSGGGSPSVVWLAPTLAAAGGVMPFASTTARDAAIPSPTDGMVAVTGTGSSQQVWLCVGGVWLVLHQGRTTYTPTVAGITIGNGSVEAEYVRSLGRVSVWVTITLGSSSSVTGNISISIPIPPAGPIRSGTGVIRPAASGTVYATVPYAIASSTVVVPAILGTGGSLGSANASSPGGWSTGGVIQLEFEYPVAS